MDKPYSIPFCGLELRVNPDACCHSDGKGIRYSTEEQFTGNYWLDGKKIYHRTFVLEGFIKDQVVAFPMNIDALGQVVRIDGVVENASGAFLLPHVQVNSSSAHIGLLVNTELNEIHVRCYEANRAGHVIYVTLQYTCTDR